jgi:hypothetical protein
MLAARNAASGSSHEASFLSTNTRTWARRFYHAWQVAIATLREIFDENAYERFLLRTQSSRSIASYRAFLREREAAMVRRPRCC